MCMTSRLWAHQESPRRQRILRCFRRQSSARPTLRRQPGGMGSTRLGAPAHAAWRPKLRLPLPGHGRGRPAGCPAPLRSLDHDRRSWFRHDSGDDRRARAGVAGAEDRSRVLAGREESRYGLAGACHERLRDPRPRPRRRDSGRGCLYDGRPKPDYGGLAHVRRLDAAERPPLSLSTSVPTRGAARIDRGRSHGGRSAPHRTAPGGFAPHSFRIWRWAISSRPPSPASPPPPVAS